MAGGSKSRMEPGVGQQIYDQGADILRARSRSHRLRAQTSRFWRSAVRAEVIEAEGSLGRVHDVSGTNLPFYSVPRTSPLFGNPDPQDPETRRLLTHSGIDCGHRLHRYNVKRSCQLIGHRLSVLGNLQTPSRWPP